MKEPINLLRITILIKFKNEVTIHIYTPHNVRKFQQFSDFKKVDISTRHVHSKSI